jgi:hypothetical protein
VAVVKSSLGITPPSWRYRVVDSKVIPKLSSSSTREPKPYGRIEWLEESDLSADDVLAKFQQKKQPSKVDEAEDFLRSILSSGAKFKSEVIEAAKEQGISEASIKRAKSRLSVKCAKDGFQGETKWFISNGEE